VAQPRSAFDAAYCALRVRDLSTLELGERLAAKGFPETERQDVIATLQRTGVLDERRFAQGRAASLASRRSGDLLIRDALVRVGVDPEVVEETLAALEPEADRARAVVAKRGAGPRTARYLRAKGFAYETVSAVVADEPVDEIG
jgi:SOS response regulatory protein OraA/RecX